MSPSRQLAIQNQPFHGTSVVYVMSRDQRVQDNHALLDAQATAQQHNVPLYVLFVLRHVPGRSREHYTFMLAGLQGVHDALALHGIPFILRAGEPAAVIATVCREVDAGALFFDFSPLAGARALIKTVATTFAGPVTVVDTHNCIPAWIVSDKQEFAAHTMRAKVHQKLGRFLVAPPPLQRQERPVRSAVDSLSFEQAAAYVQPVPTAGITLGMSAGEEPAAARLKQFIDNNLADYALRRNDIAQDYQSGFSPYLHFGHLSSLRVILDVMEAVQHPPLLLEQAKLAEHGDQPSRVEGMNALFEELIVRKELSDNFCFYASEYLTLAAAPGWARKSLAAHAGDTREVIYSLPELENAATHDIIWNAAHMEMRRFGKMHGYLRMYWAKKILEWSSTPEAALQAAILLNDKYSIDGGDPNGYVGMLWSIAGLHDRPWIERPVFGQIRYMNAAGLRRKFDIDAYIQRVQSV